jgi:hypothetical protein
VTIIIKAESLIQPVIAACRVTSALRAAMPEDVVRLNGAAR